MSDRPWVMPRFCKAAVDFRAILACPDQLCEASIMTLFWIFLALAVMLMVGNALTLLRTAKRPKLPEGVKPQPYRDDEEN